MNIDYDVAAGVHRKVIAALDEISTSVMAVAESGVTEWPYDRGYVDGVTTITEAMKKGFNEALARVQPADSSPEDVKTPSGGHADRSSTEQQSTHT